MEHICEITCKRSNFFRKFALKNRFFLNCLKKSKLPEKVEIFRIFFRKSEFFSPGSTTPRFQTRLTPLTCTKCDVIRIGNLDHENLRNEGLRKLETFEMSIWCRMESVSWMELRT